MYIEQILTLILLFPFCGFLFLSLGKKIPQKQLGIIASFSIFCSFIISIYLFYYFLLSEKELQYNLYTWITIANFKVSFGLFLDKLNFILVLLITGIGFLIHFYSIGYMKSEKSAYRYFSFLNLFVFFMLLLVMADNLLLLFLGWEGVGLCSALLIGFYLEKKAASQAAQKAFVVNRIGDCCFVIALMLIFLYFGAFDFTTIQTSLSSNSSQPIPTSAINWIGLLLLLSATGKSAQVPLHIWLPDAMEGPTPVSALIHAATMVTAGVYLLTRMHFLIALSPLVLNIALILGAITALLGACIATVQMDLKKLLAYSTISQLGYMFMALGVGAFSSAIFHLTTHAFFKALLFLSAGALIYVLNHEQNLGKMGGLRKSLPKLWIVFSVGAWSLAGLPLAAGFFSKDEILWNIYQGSFFPQWFLIIGINNSIFILTLYL